jgi:hypothetical protein
MPPKGKRRKNDISAEEQHIYDNLEALMYKYRHENEEEDTGMFGDEHVLVHVDSVPDIFQALDLKWDASVLAILSPDQKAVDFSMIKLIFKTISVKCAVVCINVQITLTLRPFKSKKLTLNTCSRPFQMQKLVQ